MDVHLLTFYVEKSVRSSACVPAHAKTIAAAEAALTLKRSISLKVLSELKLSGLHHPPPFAPLVAAPSEMKFSVPDYSSALPFSLQP